jgi:putative CocE/NonD family hydrolase
LEGVVRIPLLITLASAAVWAAAPAGMVTDLHVEIPMRDGPHLSANIFRPGQPGRVPTILYRTPYGKGVAITPNYQAFVNRGYAVVVEDVRGRFESGGVFRPLEQESQDGDDTLNWIAGQPWSDGKVGMTGGSYLGIVQWKAALLNNPHLKAIFPWVSGCDDYRDRFYSPGGAMRLGHRLLWMAENMKVPGYHGDFSKYVLHLPLRTSDRLATGQATAMYQAALNHPAYDGFWKKVSTREQLRKIRVPVFSVGGWYDTFIESDLEAFSALRKTSGLHRIVVGPWAHDLRYKFAGADFGPDSVVPLRGLQLQWFDQWLKGKDTPVVSGVPVRIFVMGANRWREEREWPPAEARLTPFYLNGKGRANTLVGDGALGTKPPRRKAEDRFTYDPRDPVPTRGGAACCNPKVFAWGPMDQRPVEKRADVLVYTSKTLRRDLEVTGPVRLVLWASTGARDTDFTAKLVDVFPNGEARNLTDGILRLRYRESLERPALAQPGQIYQLSLDLGVTSNLFRKGHRVRLEVSSSNFPRFDRNPNTGGAIAEETRLNKAVQTIYHDSDHPSHLLLPVMP